MGKNGEAIRNAKKQNVTYTFTKEQLMSHDIDVRKEFLAKMKDTIEQESNKRANEIFDLKYAEMLNNTMALLTAMSIRVLVDKCGFKPYTNNKRSKLANFVVELGNEVNDVINDDDPNASYQDYYNMVYEKCGIKIVANENEASADISGL